VACRSPERNFGTGRAARWAHAGNKALARRA
jgi:hypothetical protein